MEIPYGKREFIAEEEEQQQQPPAVQPAPPIEEPSIQVTQENCHAPTHKMVVVQEQHSHVHLLVRIKKNDYFHNYLIFRPCKKIMNLLQNGLKRKNHPPSMLK
jgi:hypothetical protein